MYVDVPVVAMRPNNTIETLTTKITLQSNCAPSFVALIPLTGSYIWHLACETPTPLTPKGSLSEQEEKDTERNQLIQVDLENDRFCYSFLLLPFYGHYTAQPALAGTPS